MFLNGYETALSLSVSPATILPFYTLPQFHCDIVTITESPVIVHQRTRSSKVAGGCRGWGEARVWKYEYQEQDPLMLSAAMEAPELHCVLDDNVILTALSLEYQIGRLSLT